MQKIITSPCHYVLFNVYTIQNYITAFSAMIIIFVNSQDRSEIVCKIVVLKKMQTSPVRFRITERERRRKPEATTVHRAKGSSNQSVRETLASGSNILQRAKLERIDMEEKAYALLLQVMVGDGSYEIRCHREKPLANVVILC